MASAIEMLLRGPSLSFVSGGQEFKLVEPWTDELLLQICTGKLVQPVRRVLGSTAFHKWMPGKKRADLDQLLRDSFTTLGLDGKKLHELLIILASDKHCRALEADLLRMGQSLANLEDGLTLFSLCCFYESLPDDSRLLTVMADKKPSDWNRVEYMLADIADLLNTILMFGHINAQLQGMKKKPKMPKPIYKRPNSEDDKPKEFHSPLKLKHLLNAGRK